MSAILYKCDKPDRGDPANHPDLMFFCPGCKCGHGVWLEQPNSLGARWTWNGSMDKPTFKPSLKINGVEMTTAGKTDYEAWRVAGCPPRNGKDFDSKPSCCHSVITDGVIHFCGDCTHELAGKAVPMEAF